MTSATATIASNSSELRGAVLAYVLHHVVMVPGPVTYSAVFHSTFEAMSKPEEECGLEIMAAAHLLVRSGLLVSNTYDGDALNIGAETVLTAAPIITGWIWRDPDGDAANDNSLETEGE